jgi:hypothetical protein
MDPVLGLVMVDFVHFSKQWIWQRFLWMMVVIIQLFGPFLIELKDLKTFS